MKTYVHLSLALPGVGLATPANVGRSEVNGPKVYPIDTQILMLVGVFRLLYARIHARRDRDDACGI